MQAIRARGITIWYPFGSKQENTVRVNETSDSPGGGHQKGLGPWWWTAIRLRTLSLAAVPVLVGSALARADGATIAWLTLVVTLSCALAIQMGTNLFNDVGDAMRGNDGPDRVGPRRATAAGLATPSQVRRAAVFSFVVAMSLGAYLVLVGGWPILLLGLLSLLAGWAYSSGPRPLSYTAWGEVLVVLFFGIVAVVGSHYLQSGRFVVSALLAGLVLGTPAAAVLLVNNVRDLGPDVRVGRATLAIVLGPDRARWLYALLMLLPFPMLFLFDHPVMVWTALLALPLFIWLSWRFLRLPDGGRFNAHLAHTAQAQLLLGVLLVIGFWQ